MVATELVKPIIISFGIGFVCGIAVTFYVLYKLADTLWDKLTEIFRRKKIKEDEY